jgi:flagellar basal body-associated protein FliL
MAFEIIAKLKKRIKIMWVIICTLVVLLAASSAYNVYLKKHTFERKTEAYYTVPEKEKLLCIPRADKKRKKVK